MEFALCLRMRQSNINSVTTGGKEVTFETFKDGCSTFIYIALTMEKPEQLTIKHEVHDTHLFGGTLSESSSV